MASIKRYCSRCEKEIKDTGYYLQIYQRANRKHKDNGFLCDDCTKKFSKFMKEVSA